MEVRSTNGVFANSTKVTLNSAGTYEFWAIYSGDANNNADTSSCFTETVIVDKNTPAVTTQVKSTGPDGVIGGGDDTLIGDGDHVAIGTEVFDTATMTGATANASGTVVYRYAPLADNLTCSASQGTEIGGGAVTNGSFANSTTVTLNSAGTYEFWAIYSGDANNNADTSSCFTETVIVDKNTPAVTTQVKSTGPDGSSVVGTTR